MTEPDFNFLTRQNERILTELGSLRDDITVLTGIAIRLEGALDGLTVEVRGLRSKLDRLDQRVRKLEDTAAP
jgi:predicted nuclease with TOPRIM domain